MTFDLRFVSSFARSSARAVKVLLATGVAEGCEGSARCEGCGRPQGFSLPLMTAKLQLAVEVPSLPGMCSTRSFMSSPRGFIAKLQCLPPSLLRRFNTKLPSLLRRFAAKLHSLLRRFITKLQTLPPSLLRRFTTKLPSLLRRLTAKLQSLPRGLWMQVS